jgi:hypothetical protein
MFEIILLFTLPGILFTLYAFLVLNKDNEPEDHYY